MLIRKAVHDDLDNLTSLLEDYRKFYKKDPAPVAAKNFLAEYAKPAAKPSLKKEALYEIKHEKETNNLISTISPLTGAVKMIFSYSSRSFI